MFRSNLLNMIIKILIRKLTKKRMNHIWGKKKKKYNASNSGARVHVAVQFH